MPTNTQPDAAPTVLARNLERLMHQHNISQSKLARETGVNQPSIHRILTGKLVLPRQDSLIELAKFFNVAADDLRYSDLSDQTLLPVHLRGYRIPLMTAQNAGLLPKKPAVRHDGDSMVVYHKVSDTAFAMPVSDRAMEPRFNLNDTVVVDPAIQSGPGNFIAARIEGLPEAVVRQLSSGASLHPLNAHYPEITAQFVVLGRIVLRQEVIA